MSDVRDPKTDQQLPVPNQSRPIADLVCEDLQKRKEHGTRKYGTPLQAHNGRSASRDAYEESLDLTQYLKQKAIEDATSLRVWPYADAPPAYLIQESEWDRQLAEYVIFAPPGMAEAAHGLAACLTKREADVATYPDGSLVITTYSA